MIRLNDIIEKVNSYIDLKQQDIDLIQKAYVYSAKVHAGQKRVSGEPYLSHPLEVSAILCDLQLDIPSIITGFLHDTVEDTLATLEEIESLFGDEICFLVDGTTKISRLPNITDVEKQAESFRKLILATAKDIRVVLVKLADRLHNMRTLEHLNKERQIKISNETMEIYAPLAHRLGINWISTELEDLAFKFSDPAEYLRLSKLVSKKKKEWKNYVKEVKSSLQNKMKEIGVKSKITGRFKHIYGIHKKMNDRNMDFQNIYDVLAFRIITKEVNECYQALGAVHQIWKPIPGRIKDYVALPKANGYQSLHTTVIGPFGEQMEIQIRTEEMHHFAEYGVAAHWNYKEGATNGSGNESVEVYSNLRQLIEFKDIKDPTEFIEAIKGELISDVIYVYTPNADLIELPAGATPVDFAYAIHSDIGNHCTRALVNRNMVALDCKLKTGDTVEIITSKDKVPNRDWLDFVITSKAKTRIRSWLREEENTKALEVGESITKRKFVASKLNIQKLLEKKKLDTALKKLKFNNIQDFYKAVGFGTISANELIKTIKPDEVVDKDEKNKRIKSIVDKINKPEFNNAVLVKGYDNILIRFGNCCTPVPGEPIIGFITRGRGITAHKSNCPKLFEVDPERRIQINWDDKFSGQLPTTIVIKCQDKPGILSNLTKLISNSDVNISKVEMNQTITGQAIGTFDITVKNIEQLDHVINSLKAVEGVMLVERPSST